jgi:hypothetical protein
MPITQELTLPALAEWRSLAIPVIVNSNGQLGVGTSSKRFKDQIKSMGDASEVILALKPVSFRYKNDVDPKCITRFGLMAKDVEG